MKMYKHKDTASPIGSANALLSPSGNCNPRFMFRFSFFLFALVFISTTRLTARDYIVDSAAEFNDLDLSPGDVVIWKNGSYSSKQKISFTDNGTASQPITLRAETPGGVIFTGETSAEISGNHLIIDGFYWKGGAGTNNHVQFRKNETYAHYVTLRNCAFNNLKPDGTNKHRWIVLYGTHNTIENCSFLNKNSPGALILVELTYNDSNPVNHRIVNNYFYNFVKRDSGETNAGDSETIRIGSSKDQNKRASTLVSGNYFYKADGENEIITNKSADNSYVNNTFRACRGSLVLRHGARATIDGNFFLGENIEGTGGIRVSDSDHTITNNYIQEVISSDDNWNNGITLVGGSETSGGTSSGYQKVDDIVIAFNTIYNADSPIFYFGRSHHDPTGIMAYNLIYSTKSKIVGGDISGTGQGMDYQGNIFGGSSVGMSDAGISTANANFSARGEIYKPSSTGAAANAAGGNYNAIINQDIEGRNRPNNNMDVGAHEVSGGSGSVTHTPLTNTDVGTIVGACFVNYKGNTSSRCENGETLEITPNQGLINTGIAGDPVRVWASNEQIDNTRNNIAENSLDKDSDTKWAGSGIGVNITYDLGKTYDLEQIRIATQAGKTYFYEIQTSSDGSFFGTVAEVKSNNLGSFENYSFSHTARYIRIVGNGQINGSAWCSIFEIEFYGKASSNSGGNSSCSSGTDLARDASISSFSDQQNTINGVDNILDGDGDSRWSAEGFPQSVVIDLGAVYMVDQVNLYPYKDRAYQFKVQGSATSAQNGYKTMRDATTNTKGGPVIQRSFTAQNVRYVRLTITGALGYTGPWSSIEDFEVICAGGYASKNANPTSNASANIYPNPAQQFLNIDTTGLRNETLVSLYSLVGQLVQTQLLKAQRNRIDISGLPVGAYLVRIDHPDVLKQKTVRFIKI